MSEETTARSGDARLIVSSANHQQLILDALDGAAAHLEVSHDAQDSDDGWIVDLYATVQAALAAVRGLEV